MTLPVVAISNLIKSASSAGVPGTASVPEPKSCCLISGKFSVRFISAFSCSITAGGVCMGANMRHSFVISGETENVTGESGRGSRYDAQVVDACLNVFREGAFQPIG